MVLIRSTGSALVSPKDLKLAEPYISQHTSQFAFRTFPSGLTVLHTPHFSQSAFSSRLLEALDTNEAIAHSLKNPHSEWETGGPGGEGRDSRGLTSLEISGREGIGLSLVREMVEEF